MDRCQGDADERQMPSHARRTSRYSRRLFERITNIAHRGIAYRYTIAPRLYTYAISRGLSVLRGGRDKPIAGSSIAQRSSPSTPDTAVLSL